MEYNVAKERFRFFREQDKLAEEYRKAGMTEEQIKVMFDFDYEAFKKERNYRRHNCGMVPEAFDEEEMPEDKAGLVYRNIEKFMAEADTYDPSDHFGWVEKVNDQKLYEALQVVSETDMELLTLYFIEGYTQVELAKMKGVTKQTMGRKINRIKNFLKKFLKDADF